MQHNPSLRKLTIAAQDVTLRAPRAEDGANVARLVRASGALDTNSLYCNLLQCTHFAGTCVLAERDGAPLGWVSGYVPPMQPDTFFVWQVCTSPEARGLGLAQAMIAELLARPALSGIRHVECSITRENTASWRFFESIARRLQAPMRSEELFDRDLHLDGSHASERRVILGPFAVQTARAASFEKVPHPQDA
jgi:L-2,4-diaminobutyric acid acetyltransferase